MSTRWIQFCRPSQLPAELPRRRFIAGLIGGWSIGGLLGQRNRRLVDSAAASATVVSGIADTALPPGRAAEETANIVNQLIVASNEE